MEMFEISMMRKFHGIYRVLSRLDGFRTAMIHGVQFVVNRAFIPPRGILVAVTIFVMQKKGLFLLALCSFLGSNIAAAAGTACTRISTELVADLIIPDIYSIGPDIDRGLGGPDIDVIVVEFYSAASGSFELGSGVNSNYAFCEQCLLLFQDAQSAEPTQFFADAGNLIIKQAPGTASLPIELQSVRLIEVTIDPEDFTSTPVPGGACLLLDQDFLFEDGFETLAD